MKQSVKKVTTCTLSCKDRISFKSQSWYWVTVSLPIPKMLLILGFEHLLPSIPRYVLRGTIKIWNAPQDPAPPSRWCRKKGWSLIRVTIALKDSLDKQYFGETWYHSAKQCRLFQINHLQTSYWGNPVLHQDTFRLCNEGPLWLLFTFHFLC